MTYDELLSFFTRLGLFTICFKSTGSFFSGLMIYMILDVIFMDYIMLYFYKLERVAAGNDSNFLTMDQKTMYYVTLNQKMDSINSLKDQISRNTKGARKFRSTVVTIMGKYYFKPLYGSELVEKFEQCF